MRCGAGCEMGAVVGGIVPGDRAVGPQLAVCARVAETRGADHARRRGYGDEVPSISADAEMLCAKGLTAYPTTIAKIEAGDRTVQIDELVALAEIFEVSVDTLLGHSTGRSQNKFFQMEALVDAQRQSLWQLSTTERTLRQAVTNVDGFKLNANDRTLRDGCVKRRAMRCSTLWKHW